MAKNAPLARKFDALLDALKFGAKNNKGVRKKSVNGYTLKVDFANERIIYGDKINSGDDTTANFSAQENLVVFDCVHRLLQKGYYPEHLTLEKRWKLGHTGKSGKADIVVRRLDSEKSLMIIECKTPGEEFDKEQDSMRKDGGQLFSYFQQDKAASVLALYTNTVEMGKSNPQTKIVLTSDSPQNKRLQMENENDPVTYEKASTVGESLEVWKKRDKKTFRDHGVFEDDVEPYNPGFKPLRIGDLQEFQKGDRGKLHAAFMEILRHNNISDRSNAFNRFISLVLAKMVDETNPADAIAYFQFKRGIDDADSLYERLQGLYAVAMEHYLKEEIINHTLDDIRYLIEHFPRQTTQDKLYRIYRELKLYANNEFAFKEVYNERLYKENSQVLEEVVELFQGYKFKYDKKSQFLGDFFELMLEDGYKQAEGQFFTPTPVARFIVSALPLEDVIRKKLRSKTQKKLPYVVDFACGSGHFLTESIAALQNILLYSQTGKHKAFDNSREGTDWARDFIWGMERDYRLARTSQVACFMHGDGDANIIFGDGLEKHENRELPEGKFDVLVANPPYTIKDFKKHLRVSPKNFELWDAVSINSDDIEVFFVERMAQLLAVGGYAGIVLPSTILANPGIYGKARELLMRYFEIKAVVQLGDNAFSATDLKAVVLFLRRRDKQFAKNCRYISDEIIMSGNMRPADFVDSDALYRHFLLTRDIKVDDEEISAAGGHLSLLEKSPLLGEYRKAFAESSEYKNMKKLRSFAQATAQERESQERKLFADYVLQAEGEKFYWFLLTHRHESQNAEEKKATGFSQRWLQQRVCIVKNDGDKSQQRRFLGYKNVKRRGYQGLHENEGGGLLCDAVSTDPDAIKYPQATDPGKANYYVRHSLQDKHPNPTANIAKHCAIAYLQDLMVFDRVDFAGDINVNVAKMANIESQWESSRLGDCCDFQNGLWTGKKPPFSAIRALRNTEFLPGGYLDYDKAKQISAEQKALQKRTLKPGDILLEKSGGSPNQPIGRVALFDADEGEYSFGNFIARIRPKGGELDSFYLWNYLHYFYTQGGTKSLERGVRIMNLDIDGYKAVKIPLPPLDIQQQISLECGKIDEMVINASREKVRLLESVTAQIPADNSWSNRLADVCTMTNYAPPSFEGKKPYYNTKAVGICGVEMEPEMVTYTKRPHRANCMPPPGTVGFATMKGAQKAVLVDSSLAGALFSTGFQFLTPNDGLNAKFLLAVVRSNYFQKQKDEVSSDGIMGAITLRNTANLLIPLPSKSAQNKIAGEMEAYDRRIAEINKELSAAQERKNAVLKKYLQKK